MSHPQLVLERQATLIEVLGRPQYLNYMYSFIEAEVDSASESDLSPAAKTAKALLRRDVNQTMIARRSAREDVAGWLRTVSGSLRMSEAFYVAPHMTDLIAHAAQGLDEHDQYRHEFLPADRGFAWFDAPLTSIDMWGNPSAIAAVSWRVGTATDQHGATRPGVAVVLWADCMNPNDIIGAVLEIERSPEEGERVKARLRETIGSLQPASAWMIPWGERVGPAMVATDQEYQARNWKDNEIHLGGRTVDTLPSEVPSLSRQLLAFWMLLGQTVTTVRDGEVSRPFAKRAQRRGIPARVTVIELRRHATTRNDNAETHVEWQHQWIVRGHWAWRICGQQHPDAQPYKDGWAVRLYISPYVKGPEDKPLHQAQHVYAFRR